MKFRFTLVLVLVGSLAACTYTAPEKSLIDEIESMVGDFRCDRSCLSKRLRGNPKSDFLNGMYIYLVANEDNVNFYLSWLSDLKSTLGLEGPYTKLAEAHLLRLAGRKSEARRTISEAFKSGQAKHWLYLELAALSSSKDSSLMLLDSALKLKPDFYRAKVDKAYILDVMVEYDKIIDLLEDATVLPNDTLFYSFLAEAYWIKGDHERSMVFYQKSLEVEPNSRAYIGIGNYFHYDVGQFDAALKYYSKARELDGLTISVLRPLGWLSFDLADTIQSDFYFGEILDRREELDFAELEDLIDYYLTRGSTENARLLVDDMRSRYGSTYKVLGYDVLTRWKSTSDEIFELFLEEYERDYGEESRKWLESKMDYFGYQRRIQVFKKAPET